MTEAEWLTATDPLPMLQFHERSASERKLRLFHVACCERIKHLLNVQSRSALGCARRYADGQADDGERRAEADGARAAYLDSLRRAGVARYGAAFDQMTRKASSGPGWEVEILGIDPPTAAAAAVLCAVESPYTVVGVHPTRCTAVAITMEGGPEAGSRERRVQSLLLCDIVGNPFRPMTVDPVWRTSTVVTLAKGIYADCAFDRLPILADALQDAGCDNTGLLAHCRGPGPHVRGCWVVDLMLGKP